MADGRWQIAGYRSTAPVKTLPHHHRSRSGRRPADLPAPRHRRLRPDRRIAGHGGAPALAAEPGHCRGPQGRARDGDADARRRRRRRRSRDGGRSGPDRPGGARPPEHRRPAPARGLRPGPRAGHRRRQHQGDHRRGGGRAARRGCVSSAATRWPARRREASRRRATTCSPAGRGCWRQTRRRRTTTSHGWKPSSPASARPRAGSPRRRTICCSRT